MKTFIAALRIKYPFLVNVFTWTFGLLLAWALLIFFLVAIWFVLPYQWLRLDHWYYNLSRPTFWPSQDPTLPSPRLDWFPQALDDLGSIPYETPFFIVLIILGVASAI